MVWEMNLYETILTIIQHDHIIWLNYLNGGKTWSGPFTGSEWKTEGEETNPECSFQTSVRRHDLIVT